jgi:hypothetical protein
MNAQFIGNISHMVMDITDCDWMTNPVQGAAPMYLGISPGIPDATFMKNDYAFRVIKTIPVGDKFNPFDVPVVMASRKFLREQS